MSTQASSQGLVPDPRLVEEEGVNLLVEEKGMNVMAMKAQPVLTSMRASQHYYSEEIAAKFSIAAGWGSGSGSVNLKKYAIRYEALVESEAEPLALGGGEVYDKVQAVGVTLDIWVETAESNLRLDIFSVSAAVQLQMANASYRTFVYPANAEVLKALVPSSGTLDPDNYEKLVQGIGAVKNAMAGAVELEPQPYYRPRRLVAGVEEELAMTQSITFAARYLSKSKTVNTAVDDAADAGLNATQVRLAYGLFWPEAMDDAEVPPDAKARAAAWLLDQYTEEPPA